MQTLILVVIGILSVWNSNTVDSSCCGAVCGGRCGDCTFPTPLYCGYGPCNIFGCNCDGGCRTLTECASQGGVKCTGTGGQVNYPVIACKNSNQWQCQIGGPTGRRRRSISINPQEIINNNATETVEFLFSKADVNSDGKLSHEEAVAYLRHSGLSPAMALAEVNKMDVSKDGFLSKSEIDSEYGQA